MLILGELLSIWIRRYKTNPILLYFQYNIYSHSVNNVYTGYILSIHKYVDELYSVNNIIPSRSMPNFNDWTKCPIFINLIYLQQILYTIIKMNVMRNPYVNKNTQQTFNNNPHFRRKPVYTFYSAIIYFSTIFLMETKRL